MKLTDKMTELKVTSKTLSEKTGISKRTIDGYRAGKSMNFRNGLLIADALGIDPHELKEE